MAKDWRPFGACGDVMYRTVARAMIRDATICEDSDAYMRVREVSTRVNRSVPLWLDYKQGVSRVGAKVDVRVEQLETTDDRIMFTARVIGGLK